jgi:hypothetical protein
VNKAAVNTPSYTKFDRKTGNISQKSSNNNAVRILKKGKNKVFRDLTGFKNLLGGV